MDRLDPTTLFVLSAAGLAVVALVMGFYYATQRTYAGFRDWLLGISGQAAALLALSLLGRDRPASFTALLAVLAANVVVVAGAEEFHRGTARFGGQAPRLAAADVAVYGGALAAYVWWLAFDWDVSRRIVVVSLCVAYAAAKMAGAARRQAQGAYRASGLLLAGAGLGLSLAHLARGAAAFARAGHRPQELLQRSGLEALLLAGSVGTGILAALAFMILNGRRTTVELEEALGQVKQLEGIIPICMYCKKVHVDADSWDRIEKYVMAHSNATFSHGICPECLPRVHEALGPPGRGG